MARLLTLFVFLCSMFFVGCASTTTGILNVSTSSDDDEFVVQVDSVVKIVKGSRSEVKLDTGDHFVTVSFAGKTVVDTLVHVEGRSPGDLFLAWMGGSAVGAGIMTLAWSKIWLVVVPVAVGISTLFTTSPGKVQLHAVKQNDESPQLYQSDRLFLHIWDLHPNLGISEKFGVSNVLRPDGLCYDRKVKVVWVQSEVNSRIYPLDLRKDIEVCLLDVDGEHLSCESSNNSMLEKYPCR